MVEKEKNIIKVQGTVTETLPNASFKNAVSAFINDEKRHIQENIDYVNNNDNPFKFKN